MTTQQKNVEVIEAPGGAGPYALCPNCSKMHIAHEMGIDHSDPTNPKEVVVPNMADIPGTCKRCGSPMDIDDQVDYSQKMAEAAENAPGTGRRDQMRRRRTTQLTELSQAVGGNDAPRLLKDMNVAELRAELEAYGESSDGVREELVQRLETARAALS